MPEIAADPDGCVRRRCPACRKHFATNLVQGAGQGVFLWCPYCGADRAWNRWFTPGQENFLENGLAEEGFTMVDPELDNALVDLARGSGGVIEYRPTGSRPPRAPYCESTADLVAVSIPCHPELKLKVEASWSRPVRCHLCGTEERGREGAGWS